MQSPPTVPNVALADGTLCPALGLGTWRYGEEPARRAIEHRAIRTALDIGYRLFDTAEMYAEGGAETVLGGALAAGLRAGQLRREDLFIVTKVYPHNAGRTAMTRACEASLRRLGLDRIDLYLLHWRGDIALSETIAAFESLLVAGHISRWGVSNFDTADLRELEALKGGSACAANQVYLSLSERGPEYELMPWQHERGMPLMAYSPIDQGALARNETLQRLARERGATPAQVALAALMDLPGVIAIPKSSDPNRLHENWNAGNLRLTAEDRAELDRAFPPPRRKRPLAML